MSKIYKDGAGVMKIEHIEKHPTRKILEQGDFVDEESFEIMLKEESEQDQFDTLKSIEKELIQLNKTLYEILKYISNNPQD